MPKKIRATTFLFVLLCIGPMVLAQSGDCPEIVQIAQQAADEQCVNTGRNQACYANVNLNAVPQPGITDFRFTQVGDLADVAAIQSLQLNGMNQETQEWGVVVMKLQANLPNSLPGQNVTFLLFGDVEITNAVNPDDTQFAPMQAFILQTGLGDSQCQEAPESGLLVQTPKGVGTVNFNVNGVDVAMGSTVYFQAQPGKSMRVRTVEGAAVLKAQNRIVPVVAGTQASVPMDDDLMADGEPSDPEPYDVEIVESLDFDALERDIEIAEPLDEAEIDDLLERMEAGEPICGEDFLPSCDEVPVEIGGEPCVMPASASAGNDAAPLCDIKALEDGAPGDAPIVENGGPIGEPPPPDDANEMPPEGGNEPPPAENPGEVPPPPPEGADQPPPPEESGGGEIPPPPENPGGDDGVPPPPEGG